MSERKIGEIVRSYHHTSLFDDAEIISINEYGGLTVKCVKSGTVWGWGQRPCEVVAASREEYNATDQRS